MSDETKGTLELDFCIKATYSRHYRNLMLVIRDLK